jgi:hypothetical protein
VKARESEINRVLSRYDCAEKVNMLFMIDATGSMSRHLTVVKEHMEGIASRLRKSHQRLNLSVGVLAYRDCGEPMDILDFTSDLAAFRSFFEKVRPYGGGPVGLADIHGALDRATRLSWNFNDALTRVLFHIGDAPCHGRKYHGAVIDDNLPDGDPSGLEVSVSLRTLREKHVAYFFGKINSSTNAMIKVSYVSCLLLLLYC